MNLSRTSPKKKDKSKSSRNTYRHRQRDTEKSHKSIKLEAIVNMEMVFKEAKINKIQINII